MVPFLDGHEHLLLIRADDLQVLGTEELSEMVAWSTGTTSLLPWRQADRGWHPGKSCLALWSWTSDFTSMDLNVTPLKWE